MSESDDDYYDNYNYTDEDENEPPLVSKYMDAKTFLVINIDKGITLLTEVLAEDTEKGEYTYKAYKQLARAYQIKKNYPEMISNVSKFINFETPSISSSKRENDMINFINFNKSLPKEHLRSLLSLINDTTAKNSQEFANSWVLSTLQLVEMNLDGGEYDGVESTLNKIEAFLNSNTPSNRENLIATSLYLKMRLFYHQRSFNPLRMCYFKIAKRAQSLSQRRQCEVIEIAGHLYMHDHDWFAAHRAFLFAFQNDKTFEQRVDRLKYALVSSFLTGSPVDLFVDNDARMCLENQGIACCAQLLEYLNKGDSRSFATLVRENATVFEKDANLAPYIPIVINRAHLSALQNYVACFTQVPLSSISEHLGVEMEEAEKLCQQAILYGMFAGRIVLSRTLIVFDSEELPEETRMTALQRWITAM